MLCEASRFLLNPLHLIYANEQNINWRTNILRLIGYLHFNEPSYRVVGNTRAPDIRVIIYVLIKGIVGLKDDPAGR